MTLRSIIENVVADTLSRYLVECGDCDAASVFVLRPMGYLTEELVL
jgi:hypothetical protein